MRIEGYDLMSLVDYPGHTAFVIYVGGCNWDCYYCHNERLKRGNGMEISWDAVVKQLQLRHGFIDGVVISGGEPTFQTQLQDLCYALRELHFDIKLDTNGSNPGVLKELIENKLVDYVALDVKTSLTNYPRVATPMNATGMFVRQSFELLKESGVPYEIRITAVPSAVNMENIHDIGGMIHGAKLVALQQFVPTEKCQETPYSIGELEKLAAVLWTYVKDVVIRNT